MAVREQLHRDRMQTDQSVQTLSVYLGRTAQVRACVYACVKLFLCIIVHVCMSVHANESTNVYGRSRTMGIFRLT